MYIKALCHASSIGQWTMIDCGGGMSRREIKIKNLSHPIEVGRRH